MRGPTVLIKGPHICAKKPRMHEIASKDNTFISLAVLGPSESSSFRKLCCYIFLYCLLLFISDNILTTGKYRNMILYNSI